MAKTEELLQFCGYISISISAQWRSIENLQTDSSEFSSCEICAVSKQETAVLVSDKIMLAFPGSRAVSSVSLHNRQIGFGVWEYGPDSLCLHTFG